MRIAICDDEKGVIDLISGFVNEWSALKRLPSPPRIFEFNNAESFLFHWSPETNFDIVFLDIKMGNMTGVELAKLIRKIDQSIQIVFVTGSREYVLEGYEVDALHYLMKPLKREDLFKCLDKASRKMSKLDEQSLLVTIQKKTYRLPYSSILYFESFDNATVAHTTNGDYKFRQRIGSLEAELDPSQFVSVHRSFIVGIAHIREIGKKNLTLDGGFELPISQARWQEVNRVFFEFHMQK